MGEATFNVKCSVQYSEAPIVLGVTGQCLKVKPIVSYENFDGRTITLKTNVINDVRLKPMVPYQKEQITFTISNAGKTGFYFIWFINTELYSDRVKFSFKDQEGYVTTDSDTRSTICITPLKNTLLKGVKLKLQVPNKFSKKKKKNTAKKFSLDTIWPHIYFAVKRRCVKFPLQFLF